LRPLQTVAGIIERRHTQPILANVLLERNHQSVSLTGSDSEIQICATAELAIGELEVAHAQDASTTVAARKLLDILRAMPDNGLVTLNLANKRLSVAAGKSRFTLQTLGAEAFPTTILNNTGTVKLTLPQKQLRDLFGQVYYAMAQQDIRFYLNGLLLMVNGQNLTAVATDAHRLAVAVTQSAALDAQQPKSEVILPRKTVLELQRLLGDTEKPVTIEISANQARFLFVDDHNTSIQVVTKLVEGKFPDWQRVIPQNHPNELHLSREAFTRALSRVAIMTGEKFRAVHVHLTEGLLRVQAQNAEQEEATDEIEVDYAGTELDVGFNVSYLLDCLNNIKSENIVLHFGAPGSSVILTVPDVAEFRYVVMPVRI
jgi:DNA polymerase-3 subunit beta